MNKTTKKTNLDSVSQMSCQKLQETFLSQPINNAKPTRSSQSNGSASLSEQSNQLASQLIPTSNARPRTERRIDKIVGVSSKGVPIGEFSPHAKYTDRECDEVFALREEGLSFGEIGRILDMPKQTVWAIYTGIRRGHVIAKYKRK